MRALISLVACALFAGCVAVPQTKIDWCDFHLRAPKDVDLSGLTITKMTNGAVQVSVQKYNAKMNPDVVGQSAAGQAQIVQATMQGAGGMLGEMLAKALAAYTGKVPVPTPPTQ